MRTGTIELGMVAIQMSREDRNLLIYALDQALPKFTVEDCERARKLRIRLAAEKEEVDDATR